MAIFHESAAMKAARRRKEREAAREQEGMALVKDTIRDAVKGQVFSQHPMTYNRETGHMESYIPTPAVIEISLEALREKEQRLAEARAEFARLYGAGGGFYDPDSKMRYTLFRIRRVIADLMMALALEEPERVARYYDEIVTRNEGW